MLCCIPPQYRLSKVVTFTPRFIVKNNMSNNISYREYGTSSLKTLHRGERAPLYF